MRPEEIIAGTVAAAALLALLLWLLSRAYRRSKDGGGMSAEEAARRAARNAADRAAQEARLQAAAAKRADAVAEIAQADPRLGERMLKMAGQSHRQLRDVSESREAALQVARSLTDDQVHALKLAASQTDVELDLASERRRERSVCPTDDIEPEPMSDFSQIHQVTPEQLVMDDEPFYQALAEQQLTVLQPFEAQTHRKRLYLLLDVSGSMRDAMADGLPRHVWARGVSINLLLRALDGEAEYLLRSFDDRPHELLEAAGPKQAEELIDHLLARGFSGGGTNIIGALTQAARDIRGRETGITCSDILLITDGQDDALKEATVRNLLGDDIRLHVVQLGPSGGVLPQVAASYRSFK